MCVTHQDENVVSFTHTPRDSSHPSSPIPSSPEPHRFESAVSGSRVTKPSVVDGVNGHHRAHSAPHAVSGDACVASAEEGGAKCAKKDSDEESDEDDDVPDWLYITDDGAFRAFRGYRGRNVCAS